MTLIKVVCPMPPIAGVHRLSRQLMPDFSARTGLNFTFDPEARGYDWLVVYENLPAADGERRPMRVEALDCPPENTVLLTTEPSSIKIYDRAYVRQFGHVVTSQEEWVLRHRGRLTSQAGLRWFYGEGSQKLLSAAEILAAEPQKIATVATVCSTKRQGHTLHRTRFDFTEWLARELPDLQVFGRGRRPIDDKAEAVAPFRYHLAIENHLAPHHFTEKLADPFLGLSLPFYFGCPNADDYFPADSFIAIDIRKPREALDIMRAAIAGNEYERRLPALIEARRRVIEEHSLFPLIARVVDSATPGARRVDGAVLRSQRAARKAHPLSAVGDYLRKQVIHTTNRLANLVTR